MSKTDAAPMHWWVIRSYFDRWIVRICLLTTAVILVAGWTVVMKLEDDCTNATNWRVVVYDHVIELGVSKTPETCLENAIAG